MKKKINSSHINLFVQQLKFFSILCDSTHARVKQYEDVDF